MRSIIPFILTAQLLKTTFTLMKPIAPFYTGRRHELATMIPTTDEGKRTVLAPPSATNLGSQPQQTYSTQDRPLDLSKHGHPETQPNPGSTTIPEPLNKEYPLDLSVSGSSKRKRDSGRPQDETSFPKKRPAFEEKRGARTSPQPKLPFLHPEIQSQPLAEQFQPHPFSSPASTLFHLDQSRPSHPSSSSPILDHPKFFSTSNHNDPHIFDQSGSHLVLPGNYQSPDSSPGTPTPRTPFSPSYSGVPVSQDFQSTPKNNKDKIIVNISSKLVHKFPEVLFLSSKTLKTFNGAIELKKKYYATRLTDPFKKAKKIIVDPHPQPVSVYRVFLFCKNFKNYYKTKRNLSQENWEHVDFRIKNHFNSNAHLRNPENKLELINDARIQIFVFKEILRVDGFGSQASYRILKKDVFKLVSEKFWEYRASNKSSVLNDSWNGFLESCGKEKIGYSLYSEILKEVCLVTYFDIKYSGVAHEKAKVDKGKHGYLDFEYGTIYYDILDELGQSVLERLDITIKNSPMFLCIRDSNTYASLITGSSIYANLEFGERSKFRANAGIFQITR